jgi:hypothetical protein
MWWYQRPPQEGSGPRGDMCQHWIPPYQGTGPDICCAMCRLQNPTCQKTGLGVTRMNTRAYLDRKAGSKESWAIWQHWSLLRNKRHVATLEPILIEVGPKVLFHMSIPKSTSIERWVRMSIMLYDSIRAYVRKAGVEKTCGSFGAYVGGWWLWKPSGNVSKVDQTDWVRQLAGWISYYNVGVQKILSWPLARYVPNY